MSNSKTETIKLLEDIAFEIRNDLIRLAGQATIHIGGDLSATDILTVLWQNILKYNIRNPSYENRDRFILSKGHCAAAAAFNMAKRGCFDKEDIFKEYASDNTRFSMAPCRHTNPFWESSATGSLGQGIPLACGIAAGLIAKHNNISKVYVLAGDGELQEGSNWESVMYAGHAVLNNLVVIIDNNRLQFDGQTENIVKVENINDKFRAFYWEIYDVNGHDIGELLNVFEEIQKQDKPVLINAHTIKGKGVEYMENNYLWHAGRIEPDRLDETIMSLKREYGRE